MDTDDFSAKTYAVLVQAARSSDTLKSEFGAMSRNYRTEDDWLRGVQMHLLAIMENPEDYVDSWSLEEFEGVTAAIISKFVIVLYRQVNAVLAVPLNERGKREW